MGLWEEATQRALGLEFGGLLAELRLLLLRDAEHVLLDRATCVRALFGVKQILDLARSRTPWHHLSPAAVPGDSSSADAGALRAQTVEGCAIPDHLAHLFIRRLVGRGMAGDGAVEQEEAEGEGEAVEADQEGGAEEEGGVEDEDEEEELCPKRAGMAKAVFMASWRASLGQVSLVNSLFSCLFLSAPLARDVGSFRCLAMSVFFVALSSARPHPHSNSRLVRRPSKLWHGSSAWSEVNGRTVCGYGKAGESR